MKLLREALGFFVAAAGVSALALLMGDGTRDLVLTFGGGLIGYTGSRVAGAVVQARREAGVRAAATRFASGASIDWGRLHLPGSFVVAICGRGVPLSDFARFEFARELAPERSAPPEWPVLERTVLTTLRKRAASEGRLFEDERAVDLVDVSILPPRRGEPVTCRLTAAPTSYFRFAASANVLDLELPKRAGFRAPTLRESWQEHRPAQLGDVRALPVPAKVGTVTVVVSSDGLLIGQERGRVFQAGSVDGERRRLHFVGEGMTPDDLGPDGRLATEVTAARGIAEELGGLTPRGPLIPTGVFFDGERWQPVFCYLVEVEETAAEIAISLKQATHSFETVDIHPRVWTVDDPQTRALLTGDDPALVLASTHAEVALVAALAYRDGIERVVATLNG